MISCFLAGPLSFYLLCFSVSLDDGTDRRLQQLKIIFTPLCIACSSHIHSVATISRWIPLWPGNYLPAVALGRGRGRGALVNRCGGGLVDWGATPLLRAHGAAMGATLVLVVVRHVGHQLAPWTSLSTGPRGSAASSDTRSQLAVHLKKKTKVRKLHHRIYLTFLILSQCCLYQTQTHMNVKSNDTSSGLFLEGTCD